MSTNNVNTTSVNNLYLRVAVILLAINFIVNGYFVYTLLKVSELNQDVSITAKDSFSKR